VYAGIALPNPGSIALHERFGFKRVAHFTSRAASLVNIGTSPGSKSRSVASWTNEIGGNRMQVDRVES
jgi:RimJ/RimL family protein N-acetyltransferase